MLAETEQYEFGRFERENDSAPEDRFSICGASLPEDLRDLIGETELAHLVEDAVRQVSRTNDIADRTQAWDVLLGILTYSYATGLYSSDEISTSLNNNPSAAPVHRLAFASAEPSSVLRGFRRRNRGAIEECLAQVLHFCSSSVRLPFEFHAEAENRLARAIEADCWALDV